MDQIWAYYYSSLEHRSELSIFLSQFFVMESKKECLISIFVNETLSRWSWQSSDTTSVFSFYMQKKQNNMYKSYSSPILYKFVSSVVCCLIFVKTQLEWKNITPPMTVMNWNYTSLKPVQMYTVSWVPITLSGQRRKLMWQIVYPPFLSY